MLRGHVLALVSVQEVAEMVHRGGHAATGVHQMARCWGGYTATMAIARHLGMHASGGIVLCCLSASHCLGHRSSAAAMHAHKCSGWRRLAAVHQQDGTAKGQACRRQVLLQWAGGEATGQALQRLDSRW
jgi:hypothetical protein